MYVHTTYDVGKKVHALRLTWREGWHRKNVSTVMQVCQWKTQKERSISEYHDGN